MKLNIKLIIWAVAIALAVFLGVLYINYILSVDKYQNAVRGMTFAHIDVKTIPDGTYEGDCNVDFIYAKVSITVKSGTITDIEILEHKNERGSSAEKIIDEMIAKQTLDVDAVSGATNSSVVLRKAVENALLQ